MYSVYSICVCISPWIAVPYTHQFAVCIPISILYLWEQYKNKDKFKYLIGMSFLTGIGYKLTPLCILVTIAICIIELLSLSFSRLNVLKILRNTAIIFLITFITIFTIGRYEDYWAKRNEIPIRSELQFGIAHYLNMGINGTGIYNSDDVLYSYSLQTKEELHDMNIKIFKERVQNMTFSEIITHYIKKIFTTTGDASFGSKGETVDRYVRDVPEKNHFMSKILRNIFRPEGKYNVWYRFFLQVLWGVLVAGTFIAGLLEIRDGQILPITIMLSVSGALLYDMLFESNCHHLFTNVSLIALLCGLGVNRIPNTCPFITMLSKKHNYSK